MKKNILVQIILFSILIFILDFSVLKFLKKETVEFVYPIPLLICFFAIFSLIILFILKYISKKNINNVGLIFLFLTSVKLILAYVFLKPILNSTSLIAASEKINFFVIFILFLTIETVLTIRILNNKQ